MCVLVNVCVPNTMFVCFVCDVLYDAVGRVFGVLCVIVCMLVCVCACVCVCCVVGCVCVVCGVLSNEVWIDS